MPISRGCPASLPRRTGFRDNVSTIGSDLGAAVKGFKKSVSEGEQEDSPRQIKSDAPDADFAEASKTSSESKTTNRSA